MQAGRGFFATFTRRKANKAQLPSATDLFANFNPRHAHVQFLPAAERPHLSSKNRRRQASEFEKKEALS